MNDGTRVGLEGTRNRRGAGEGQIPAALLRSSAVVFFGFSIACGGRIDGVDVDASLTDAGGVPCYDAGVCNAGDSYCRLQLTDAGTTSISCTPFPAQCHSCDCAAPPTVNLVCACTESGEQIVVSCKPF